MYRMNQIRERNLFNVKCTRQRKRSHVEDKKRTAPMITLYSWKRNVPSYLTYSRNLANNTGRGGGGGECSGRVLRLFLKIKGG